MDTEVSAQSPRHGATVLSVFITSLAAAIVVAGGFGIVFQAGVVAAAARLGLGTTFIWVGTIINAAITLWLALWTFARSWHVERRLKAGLEVDEPKLSILANFRGSYPLPRERNPRPSGVDSSHAAAPKSPYALAKAVQSGGVRHVDLGKARRRRGWIGDRRADRGSSWRRRRALRHRS